MQMSPTSSTIRRAHRQALWPRHRRELSRGVEVVRILGAGAWGPGLTSSANRGIATSASRSDAPRQRSTTGRTAPLPPSGLINTAVPPSQAAGGSSFVSPTPATYLTTERPPAEYLDAVEDYATAFDIV